MYKILNKELCGQVAVKVHSGEKGNQNFLKPDFWKPMIEHVNGVVTECNTAYDGERNTTEKHKELMKIHKWSDYFDVDIMDEEDESLPAQLGVHKGGAALPGIFLLRRRGCSFLRCTDVPEPP